MSSNNALVLKRWRRRIIVSTWLSYAGYYFCRKPFYKAKATLQVQAGLSTDALGWVGFSYLSAYSIGQFSAAALGTRIGARRMLLAGMAGSVACNLAAGSLTGLLPLLIAMATNGLVQATGWPGNVGTMAAWTRRDERGTIMGLWSTCYQVGGLAAGIFASLLLASSFGWRAPFFGGAAVLLSVWVLFFFWQRNRPEDVGLPSLQEATGQSTRESAHGNLGSGGRERHKADAVPSPPKTGLDWDRRTIATVVLMGAIYACVKFIRYLLLSWAAYFLQIHFRLPRGKAGLYAEVFDLSGLFGAISAGVISDRFFKGRRSPVIVGMLAMMTLGCIFLWVMGTRSVPLFVVGLGAVGFMLYGPDSLLSGAGAMDIGKANGAVAAAGIINGMGSAGSVLQEKLVGSLLSSQNGLGKIFGFLAAAGACALALMLVQTWRNRNSETPL